LNYVIFSNYVIVWLVQFFRILASGIWCSAVLAFYFLGFLSFCFRFGLFCLWLMVSASLYFLGFFAAYVMKQGL
jgi:hypothetical protein